MIFCSSANAVMARENAAKHEKATVRKKTVVQSARAAARSKNTYLTHIISVLLQDAEGLGLQSH